MKNLDDLQTLVLLAVHPEKLAEQLSEVGDKKWLQYAYVILKKLKNRKRKKTAKNVFLLELLKTLAEQEKQLSLVRGDR